VTASEKLKALLIESDENDDVPLPIPQIVAVVEAAEREHPGPHNYWAIDAEMNEIEDCPTCAALAALEEALS
jgi:hypothetical protein